MSKQVSILILIAAALLEAGGDAAMRKGTHSFGWQRAAWFSAGAAILFSYGWAVNRPPWNFGELLGLYVVFFFVAAQAISWIVFQQTPSLAVYIGGALIVGGGLVIAILK
jgi:drug/metabolite transporter (DMT)-like permease